ncbi:MAG: response regulator [Deltaproteobacteria bacterium]|nr:response regulator [Deltaproteobacteria bacterium]
MISQADILQGRILIVDDQQANVLLLDQILRRAGYASVSSTLESEKVCELHLVNRYDLILLDLQMPGMDGFQVMENLKEVETGGYLPVLVVTAQPSHKLRALSAGARDFISKPFDVAEVLIRVHNMLEVRLLHQETKRLYDRVVLEQRVSARLLQSALPHSIAERLKEHQEVASDGSTQLVAESYAEVTVLFADIVDFTKFAEGASAEVLVGVLNDISSRFDSLKPDRVSDRRDAVGDAYLASAELPAALAEQSIRGAKMALELTEAVERFNGHSRYKLKVRIGVDTRVAGDADSSKRKHLFDL